MKSYRYAYQGQEKVDEVSGKGNSYTAEFWQYDSRLGRRWNVDPVIKPYRSPYDAFSNNPIIMIDPNGADDYYNEKGKYLYTDTRTSTDIRIIKQATFSALAYKHCFAMVDKSRSHIGLLADLSYNSEIVKVKDVEAGNIFSDMWKKSIQKPIKEYSGYIVLDINTKELRFEILENPTKQTANRVSDPYKAGDLFNGQEGVIVIAQVHTHPDELKYLAEYSDQQIFDAQYTNESHKGDGNTATKRGARYTIGKNNIDYHSPKGYKASKNNLTTRTKAAEGKFSVLRHSLKQYGGKK